MSWTLLLNKYPSAILDSPEPLLVLALIDRAGLSNEAELSRQFPGSLPELRRIILKLQMNEFLSAGEHHVKLTQAGREVVDRMALVDEVLREVLDKLKLQGDDRLSLKRILEEYRKDSFGLYQNSICTMRQWSAFTSHVADASATPYLSAEVTAGLRSLLARDLRNWSFHSRKGLDATRAAGGSIKTIIWFDDDFSELAAERRSLVQSTTRHYIQALSQEGKGQSRQPSSPDFLLLDLCLDFHSFQSSSAPDAWYDKLCVDLTPARRRGSSPLAAVGKLRKFLGSTSQASTAPKRGQSLQHFVYAWKPEAGKETTLSDMTTQILDCQSLDDFCYRTGLTPRQARGFLNEVQVATKRILSSPGTTAPGDV